MKIIKSFRSFSINEELSDVPVDGYKLFNVNSMLDFKNYLLPSLNILLSTNTGIIITDKVKELDLNNNTISFDNGSNIVNIKFNDFLLLNDDDEILKYKSGLLVDLYKSLVK
jgi:hypothetical protein